MGAGSSFPIDLILFGMIAAFLVLRLRSILGRRTGFERQAPPHQPQAGQIARRPRDRGTGGAAGDATPRTLPEPTSAIGQALGRMRSIDHSFDPAAFLDGAEKAFRIIVTAFAAGDRTTLQGLLSEDTWHAFEQAIAAREASRTDPGEHHTCHPQRNDRKCGAARAGRLHHGAVRLRSDQSDAGQGWPSCHRHRRGDRDHRHLDFRAEPLDARSGVAIGLGAQRLMRGGAR